MRMQGLGFPAISNLQTTPAFFNMLDDGMLDQPVFSLYLNPDISAEPAGELGFGLVDPSKYVGKITYTPVTEEKCAPLGPLCDLHVYPTSYKCPHKHGQLAASGHCGLRLPEAYATRVASPPLASCTDGDKLMWIIGIAGQLEQHPADVTWGSRRSPLSGTKVAVPHAVMLMACWPGAPALP